MDDDGITEFRRQQAERRETARAMDVPVLTETQASVAAILCPAEPACVSVVRGLADRAIERWLWAPTAATWDAVDWWLWRLQEVAR